MPLRELLDCKLQGIKVLDLASHFEQTLGQIRLESLYAGWLIFGDGFSHGCARTIVYRIFDFVCATFLILLSLPIMAIVKYTDAGENVTNRDWLTNALRKLGMNEAKHHLSTRSLASLQVLYFEETVEEKLWQPTFICEHPVEISPLARASDTRPEVTERFELYITGREFGNGFSELNDAEEQAARFQAQVTAKDSGDDEAMYYDHDFVRALVYGMPPTGGCGIGIDRLMMLLTDSASIRDIILFPALRRES